MQCPTQFAHEVSIGDRIRRGGIENTGEFPILDARRYHPRKIGNMNLADVLPPTADMTAQKPAGQSAEQPEKTAVGTKYDT